LKTHFKTFTKSKAEELGERGTYPTEKIISSLANMVEKNAYKQVLFELGKSYLEICLVFFESHEKYEVCNLIIKQVEEYNKDNGTQIKLDTCWI
jgi:hypothetical protein